MPKLRLMMVALIGGILALTGCQSATPSATPEIVREVVVVTATPNLAATQTVAHRPTETTIPSRGRALNSTNIWADPLDANPATSIPAGKEFELLALHPSGQWLQIAVYEDVYWIQTDQVEILGGQVSLAAPTRVVPSSTPSPQFEVVPLIPPTSTAQVIQLPTFTPVAGFAQMYQGVQYGARAAYPLDSTTLRIMRSLDMEWIRLNITHGKTNLPTLREQIELAHQQGLKVLITVRGNVAALQRDQATYFTRYAAFTKEVARLNPDALQIWEYPNVAEYWIAGDVHGASYIGLLIAAYNAIKEVNPQIQVISAPLQPVLRQQTIDRQRLDEATFLQTLYNAGGTNFIDCVGLEHLNGTSIPSLSNGKYSDNPTLFDLLDIYKDATRNQRTICITGLGYPQLSVANRFNVNRETQYSWLVIARNMVQNRHNVGMLLIENMDDTSTETTTAYRLMTAATDCYFCENYDYDRYLNSLPSGKTRLPLNLRAGPSIDFNPPIGMIRAESSIVVLAVSPDEQWYRIQERENVYTQGWVRAQDVELSAPLTGEVPVEVGSPTPIATITAIPRPSATPTPTPTPIVTATPRPSLTPSPTKAASSTPRP